VKKLLIVLAVIAALVVATNIFVSSFREGYQSARHAHAAPAIAQTSQLGPETHLCVKVISTKAGHKYGDTICGDVRIGMSEAAVSALIGDDIHHPVQTIAVAGGTVEYWQYFSPRDPDATPILLEFDNDKLAGVSQ
jgi:hypothetical protein